MRDLPNKIQCSKLCEITLVDSVICRTCKEPLAGSDDAIMYKDSFFHLFHFKCSICETALVDKLFQEKDNNLYCTECYNKKFSPVCEFCRETLKKVTFIQ